MKTHKRVGVSVCCGHATTFWQTSPGVHVCNKCDEECDTKGFDLQILKKIGPGHYRSVDNSKIGFYDKYK